MNFKDILFQLAEESRTKADAFRTTGEAIKKERAVAPATDKRAKDAARKRAERAKQVPRSRKSKEELIREIIPVQTSGGSIQLIFKDSFDTNRHQKLLRGDRLSFEEAKSYTKDPKFEQTGASKLLFGDIKAKTAEKKPSEEGAPTGPGKAEREEGEEQREAGQGEKEPKKAKKLSKEDIFTLLSQMKPEQLAQVPFETRHEYFMQTRKPGQNSDFDSLTFEKISNIYGINTLTATPYNQQVINALVFLAKLKAGASEQEIQSYAALSPTAFDFTKIAFSQARKILSQMGEQCIQNLVSSIENGSQSVGDEGSVDMECGGYKFKISAGGEFLLTTDKFDQKSKTFRGLIAASLSQAMQSPNVGNDPKLKEFARGLVDNGNDYSNILVTKDNYEIIKNNPQLMAQLQNTPVADSTGKNLGTVIDKNGNLNKWASFENYKESLVKQTANLFKNSAKKTSEFVDSFVKNILKMYYRGDMLKDPEVAPNHLITQNGIFPMTDEYFDEIAKTATVSLKPVKSQISGTNISKGNKSSEVFNRFATVVEAKEQKPKEPTIEDLLINKDNIDPLQLALSQMSTNMDFDINVSLLPGFSPKDLNTIQYNYVRIGKKTVKIPVEKTELVTALVNENLSILANELLIEAFTNNFVLDKLVRSGLLTDAEATAVSNPSMLNESAEYLKVIYNNLLERAEENPYLLTFILNSYNSELYEKYVRDYKMEYRNYHGKAKQRKERAERTKAREEMIKKGRAKRGDGKDIDHKVPLRNGGSNGINNLRSRKRSENRSDNGHKKGEKQDKDWT